MARQSDVKLLITAQNATGKVIKGIQNSVKKLSAELRGINADGNGTAFGVVDKINTALGKLRKQVGPGGAMSALAAESKKARAALDDAHSAIGRAAEKLKADTDQRRRNLVQKRLNHAVIRKTTQALKEQTAEEARLKALSKSAGRKRGGELRNPAFSGGFDRAYQAAKARRLELKKELQIQKDLRTELNKPGAYISPAQLAAGRAGVDSAVAGARQAVENIKAVDAASKETERSLGVLRKAFRTSFAGDLNAGKNRFAELQPQIKAASEEANRLGKEFIRSGARATDISREVEVARAKVRALKEEAAAVLQSRGRLAQIVNNTGRGDIQDLDRRAGKAEKLVKSDPNFNNSAAGLASMAAASKKAAGGQERFNRAQRASIALGRSQLGLFRRLRTSALAYGSVLIGFHAIGRGLGSIVDATKKIEAAQNRLRVVVGDSQTAIGQELDFVRRNAERLGIEFGMLAQEYTKFSIATKSTILEGANSRKIFLSVSEAARVNNASTEDLRGTYLALIQIISKGRITMEELKRQLGDRLPGAVHIMASALGVGTDELLKIVEAGDLSSDRLVEFADELDRRFGPGLAGALKSTQALLGKFQNTLFQASLKIGQGGFIASFNNLLITLQETLASPEFATFLDRISAGLAFMIDMLTLSIKHWRFLSIVMSGLVAIKIASVIKNIGVGMFVAAGQSVRLAQGMKFLKLAMNGAASAALRLRAGLRALRILLVGTLWGAAFVAIGALVSAFVAYKTAATDANIALQNHKKIMDDIRNLWDAAAGDVHKFIKAIEKLSKTDLRRNREASAGLYEEQKNAPRQILQRARYDNSRIGRDGSLTAIDGGIEKALAEAEKRYESFIARLESGEIQDIEKGFVAFNDTLEELFADVPGGAAIVDKLTDALRGDKGLNKALVQFVESGAAADAGDGNFTNLLNILTRAENLKLSIAELESKAAGQFSKVANLGDPDLKAIDDAKGKLDELKESAADLAQTQGVLYDKLRKAGRGAEVAGLKAKHAAENWDALNKSTAFLNTTIARLEAFKGAPDGLLGKAVSLIDDLDIKDPSEEAAKASAAIKKLTREIPGFTDLPEERAAVLVRLELDGKSLDKIKRQISDNDFTGAQASIEAAYAGHPSTIGKGEKLGDAFGNSDFGREALANAVRRQQIEDDIAKSIRQEITEQETLIKLEGYRNAGLEKRAFIHEQLAQFIGDDEKLRATLLANPAELSRLLDLYGKAFIPKKGKQGKTELEKLQEELAALIALREAREEQFGYQRSAVNEEAGGIASGRDEGLNKTRAEIAGLGDEIDLTAEKMLALLKGMEQTPEVRQMIAELELQIRDLGIEAGRIQEAILAWEDGAPILENSFVSAFDALSESLAKNEKGFKTLTAAAVGFAVSLGKAIGDVLKQQAAEKIVKGIGNLFSFNSGTSGGIDIGALFRAKVKHGGGRVGSGGRSRMVSAAPLIQKLHKGGRAQGLAANEVMAVLERDEQVLTTAQQKDINGQIRGAGKSQAPGNVNVIIVSSESEALDAALSVPEGEEVILRHLNRMKKQVKGSLE